MRVPGLVGSPVPDLGSQKYRLPHCFPDGLVALLLALLPLLAACTSTDLQQAEALAGVQRCCKRLQELPFVEVKAGNVVEAKVTVKSPSFAFQDGKSFVAPFRLAADRRYGRARIKTVISTNLLTSESQVFCPKIVFLDSEYETISDLAAPLPLTYVPPGWTSSGYWFSDFLIPARAN